MLPEGWYGEGELHACMPYLAVWDCYLLAGQEEDRQSAGTDNGNSSRRHDQDTELCLAVEFPPFYHSTHGLSRPSTPIEEHRPRYGKAISLLAPSANEGNTL